MLRGEIFSEKTNEWIQCPDWLITATRMPFGPCPTSSGFGMRLFNGTCPWSVSKKLQNFKYYRRDLMYWLGLHNNNNNNNNNNNVYLNVSEWLASLGGTKFSKPMEEMSKEELNACLSQVFLHLGKEVRWHLFQNFVDEIHKSCHWSFPSLVAAQQNRFPSSLTLLLLRQIKFSTLSWKTWEKQAK